MLIGIAKGRTGEILRKNYPLFPNQKSRKLIINHLNNSFVYLKPNDVFNSITNNIIDIGIIGEDILMENNSELKEIKKIPMGNCRMVLARNNNCIKTIYTPFINITKRYCKKNNIKANIVKVLGGTEIFLLLNKCDAIIDIADTGQTLKENNINLVEEIDKIEMCLVCKHQYYEKNKEEIDKLLCLYGLNDNNIKMEVI